MPILSLTISGDTAYSVSMLSITPAPSPALTYPINFGVSGSVWSFAFEDANTVTQYAIVYKITWPDSTFEEQTGTITPSVAPNVDLILSFPSPNTATNAQLLTITPAPMAPSVPAQMLGGNAGAAGATVFGITIANTAQVASYSYTGSVVLNGVASGFSGILVVPTGGVPAAGTWGSVRANLQYELGPINEQIYADADNTGDQTEITQLEQDSFDEADTLIQERLADAQLANTSLTVTGAVSVQTLKRVETKLACVSLCRHRGQLAADGKDVWSAMIRIKLDEAENLLGRRILFSMNNPSDPNAIPPNDPSVTPTAAPQTVRYCWNGVWGWGGWGGYGWLWGPWGVGGFPGYW